MSEIEKQFYETFGIEKKEYIQCLSIGCKHPNKDCKNCEFHDVWKTDYPPITDYILLELICKLSGACCPQFAFERGVEELKWNILKQCIHYNKELKHQVRRLFEEE